MKKSRFLIFLTCILAFVLLFSACNEEEEPPVVSDENTSEVIEETEPLPATLKFSENKHCEFYIVYPQDFDSDVKDLAIDLRKQINKYVGVELKIVSDQIMDKPYGDTGIEHQYEILLGTTNRDASKKVTEGMRSRDYTVTFDGDKIVLAGINLSMVEKACDRFVNNILIKQGKGNVGQATIELTEENKFTYVYGKYSIKSCTLLGADLMEYDIVYAKSDVYSAERFARLFHNDLSVSAGYELGLKSDSSAGRDDDGSKREILFGKTTHGGDTVETKHGFSVRASGSKLYISAECMDGYAAAYNYLTETLFKGENVEIEDGFTYTGVAEPEDKENVENRSGEYRVIFNNVHGAHVDEYPMASRNIMQAELHIEYLPDVIGLQESAACVVPYHTFIKKYGYAEVPVKVTNSNGVNYTPLLYLKDKLEVVESGYYLYDDGAGDKSKSVTWAVFKDKATGDVFAVGSTHFYWTSDDLGKSARIKDAAQLADVAKKITDKYSCPFIVGGDYNCNINSDPIKNLYSAGFENLQKISPEASTITTHHAYVPYNAELNLYLDASSVYPTKPYSSAIDHALVYNKSTLSPKLFSVLTHDYTLLSSDHCPVMVDFDIN